MVIISADVKIVVRGFAFTADPNTDVKIAAPEFAFTVDTTTDAESADLGFVRIINSKDRAGNAA